ncbi:MAG TPA: hypothetical protein P5142_15650 [Spirochaetia bacterium]|nr:hypothetical protein [Spirochaetia bacterium]
MRPWLGRTLPPLILAACLGAALRPASAQGAAAEARAQEASPGAGAPADEPAAPAAAGPAEESIFLATLPADISTASYYELVAWARSIGLSEAGSAEELRARLYAHYGVSAPPPSPSAKRTVRIERAARARYFKAEEGEGGVVRASGGVLLSVTEEGGASHRVEADELAYDREHGSVTARGSVKYVRTTGTVTETFIGEALSASLDDWSGVFLDGKVRRAGEGAKEGDRGLAMSAQTMVKRSGDVLILEKGVISSCEADDPHYSIRAGKVWLLGDKEIAIANALFSVGNVPVLWLPFFYYPGDELVFNPVFGFRSREGRFVQTTTYLLGQKPKKAETTSIFKLVDQGGTGSGRTELKGLFLRRVPGQAPKDEGMLKAMLDVYSGLGGFAGLQGSFPSAGPFTKLDFSLGLGLSRSLFDVGTANYSPYVSAGDWESVWNRSEFLGLGLPLRFGLELAGSLKAGPVSASFSLPLLSDPYFNQDFKDRSEDMDWFSFLKSSEETTTTISTTTSLAQSLSLSLSLAPKALAPWISSIDLTKVGASMSWLSMTLPVSSYPESTTLYYVDPARQFFYPSLLRPLDLAMSIKGSLLDTKGRGATEAGAPSAPAGPELRSPWAAEGAAGDGGEGEPAAPAGDGAGASGQAAAGSAEPSFRLPALAPSFPASSGAATSEPWSASIGWSLSPSAYLEDSYRNKELTEPDDIDFSRLYSLLSYRLSAGLDAKASLAPASATAALSFAYADQDQYRSYLYDEDPYIDKAASLLLADYQYKSRKLTSSLNLSSRPFASSWLWSATSLNYSLAGTLYSYKYSELVDEEPLYDESFFSWDDTSVTSHSAGLTLALRPRNLQQSLGLTMSLPPLIESYSAKLSLDGGPLDLSVQERIYRASEGEDFSFDPLTSTLSFALAPWPSLSDTFVYDTEEGYPVSNVSTFSWGPFSASLTAKRAIAYEPVLGSGWVAISGESFRASSFSMTLKEGLKSRPESRATWSIDANASLSQSLLRFSESSITFGLTAGFKLSEFIELSFSTTSQNSSAWRYYPELFSAPSSLPGWPDAYKRSFLADVWDSLSFWDSEALERGLFKLKSLSFALKHDLHDWDLSMEVTATPELKTELKKYVIEPSLTILLQWRDITEVKTKAVYDEDGFAY